MRYFKKTAALLLTTAVLFTGKTALDLNASGNEAKTAIIHVEQIHTEKREPEPTARIYSIPLADELQEYTFGLCKENDLDYEMVLAMMDRESDYREKMISKTNDYGIMQINKTNHGWLEKELGITDFLDPEQNIRAGVRMIAGLTGKYQDPHQVLMAYNLGDAGAKRLWDQGKTISEYSRSIMAKAEYLRKELRTEWQPAENASDH